MVDKYQIDKGRKIHAIMVRASRDSGFKNELKQDPKTVFIREGIALDEARQVEILENTNKDFYIAIPAKKYPAQLELTSLPKNASLDQIVRWVITQVQSNTSLKEEILVNAEKVLINQHAKIPEGMKVHIYQNTDKILYFVIPRASDEEDLSAIELEAVAGGSASRGIYSPALPAQHKGINVASYHDAYC